MKQTKIAIIGAGSVGTTIAYALMWKNIAAEIMLVDINDERCKGEILDLSDALPFCCLSKVYKGTLKNAGQTDIVIISAGARQKKDQTRAELIKINKRIIHSIIKEMKPVNKDTIIIMVTNPVDVLTYYAQSITDLSKDQIFGSGTYLDSQRLRNILSRKLNIAEQSIEAYVLGEHGDSQFIAWSCMSLAGIPITKFPSFSTGELQKISDTTRNKVYEIIKCKGATFFGIGACVADICENIIFDQKRVMPLSFYNKTLNVCLSMPAVLGSKGIEQKLPIKLNKQEQKELKQSADKIKRMIQDL